jgi:transmembrane sensor
MKSNSTSNFDYKDFLVDRKFIEWRLFRTDTYDAYWESYIENNPQCREALQMAIEKFSHVRINDHKLSDYQKEELLSKIMQQSSLLQTKRRSIHIYQWAAACVLVLFVSVSVRMFVDRTRNASMHETIIGQTLPLKDIRLVSGSKVVTIAQNSELQMSDSGTASVTQASQQTTSPIALDKEEMNKLIVPSGKRSTLVLSDGTKIWVNSGTQLEFPTHFKKDSRNISVEGEIYIEVAKNKEMPFYVHTGQFTVRVYGTSFNVSSYADSEEKSVVLVEGSVEVQTPTRIQHISPGEIFALKGDNIQYGKVDVDDYIGWKNGVFHFNRSTFAEILKKVGRYYNVDFTESNSTLMNRTCTGQLYLSEDLDQVMDIITAMSNTTYKKSGSKIYITGNDKK